MAASFCEKINIRQLEARGRRKLWIIIIPLVAGYLLAWFKPGAVSRLPLDGMTIFSLSLLLLAMGARIGNDSEIVSQLFQIGVLGLVFALAAVVGSILPIILLQLWFRRRVPRPEVNSSQLPQGSGWQLTVILLGSVSAGLAIGLLVPVNWVSGLAEATTWLLGLLLLFIGLDLGRAANVFSALRSMGWSLLLLPLGIAVGSIGVAVVVTVLWDVMAWNEAAAVASGFGWYSLSSVIISEVHSPLLGAVAFAANVLRELVAVVVTPLLGRWPLVAIAPGGATAMDVLLPVISRSAGRQYVPLAFFSGAVLSLAAGLLVNLFLLL